MCGVNTNKPGEVLPKVQTERARRGMKRANGLDLLLYCDWGTEAVAQKPLWNGENAERFLLRRQAGIDMDAVVDPVLRIFRGENPPAFVCAAPLLAAIRMRQHKLCDHGKPVAVDIFPVHEGKAALIPAASQREAERILSLMQIFAHIIRDDLHPCVISVAVWGQIFRPNATAVDMQRVQTGTADVQPRAFQIGNQYLRFRTE